MRVDQVPMLLYYPPQGSAQVYDLRSGSELPDLVGFMESRVGAKVLLICLPDRLAHVLDGAGMC